MTVNICSPNCSCGRHSKREPHVFKGTRRPFSKEHIDSMRVAQRSRRDSEDWLFQLSRRYRGKYFLYSVAVEGSKIYIGQTNNPTRRRAEQRYEGRIAESFKVLCVVEDRKEATRVEAALIRRLKTSNVLKEDGRQEL